MKFEINFLNNISYIVDTKHPRFGINRLDEIRNITGVSNLKLEIIKEPYERIIKSISHVIVTEELARKSGLFLETGLISVRVPKLFFNKFYVMDYNVKKSDETGEIQEVRGVWKLDKKTLLDAWEAAGFPTQWEDEE